MEARTQHHYTFEEYLQLEADTGCKHEYHAGQVYAMSGGTIEHGLIGGNVFSSLKTKLRAAGGNCRALNNDIKVYIASQDLYVYPDAMVVCGELQRADKESNAITNPTLVVEVLSKSSANRDRSDKFYTYRQLPSLQEYVLIEQDKAVVDIFSKQADSELWSITRTEGLDKSVTFRSLDITLAMEEVYEDVEGLG